MLSTVLSIEALAEMLHRGNSSVPDVCRRSFYGAKDFLLKAFGTPDGRDIQRIDSPCWSCNGTGLFGWHQEHCWKCDGTGVYHTRLVWLDRFKMADFCFHIPIPEVTFYGDAKPTIKGLIKHKPHADATECAFNIAWLFNRAALKDEVMSFAAFIDQVPIVGNGPGVLFANTVVRDKKLEDARKWKRICEQPVDGCPY